MMSKYGRDFAWRTLLKNPDPDPDPDVELNRILMSSICARLFLHTFPSLPACHSPVISSTPPLPRPRRASFPASHTKSQPSSTPSLSIRTRSHSPASPHPLTLAPRLKRQCDPSGAVRAYGKRDSVDLLSSQRVVEDQGSDNEDGESQPASERRRRNRRARV